MIYIALYSLVFWSGNLFLIVPFPDRCLLVPLYIIHVHIIHEQFMNEMVWIKKSLVQENQFHKLVHKFYLV